MAAIEWTYVGSLGGELIENFAATCLRQRYPNALQTKAASGDGGVDVYRERADGLAVWQIKKFTSPLTAQQRQQVKRSWARFWKTHVKAGKRIAEYILATPWTPTEDSRQWFADLTADASFPVQWDGESFFNGLASEFPATADRFFKGPDFLESMVNAKAIIAAIPVEVSGDLRMTDAIAKRERALQEIRDLANDNYIVNSGIRSTTDGELPLPGPNEAGIFHRFTVLDQNRFQVESVVPKNIQSLDVEPITVRVKFDIEKGGEDEKKIEAWMIWGVPFKDIRGNSQQVGGPFSEEESHEGLLSFMAAPNTSFRHLDLQRVGIDGLTEDVLWLNVAEVTSGVIGGGLRVVAKSPGGVLRVEMRRGSDREPDALDIRFEDSVTLNPRRVLDDLSAILRIRQGDEFVISLDGAQLLRGSGLGSAAKLGNIMAQVAQDLVDLQSHTRVDLVYPPIGGVTMEQVEHVHDLAEIYRGNARTSHWERTTMVVSKVDEIAQIVNGDGNLILVSHPTIRLSDHEFVLGRRMVQTIHSVALAPGVDISEISQGDEIELVPGPDDRITTATIVDDEF